MFKAVHVVLASALLAACASEAPQPTAPVSATAVNQSLHAPGGSPGANGANFGTSLSAAEEVMPAGVENESLARGSAVFQLNADGTELSYKLIVANIWNVTASHIHQAPAGSNGSVVALLYSSAAGGGRLDGVVAEGTITEAHLTGPLAGQPLSALVAIMTSGSAYVNVHTNDGTGSTNTGPGDFPGGEIRGQIEHRGH